MNIRLIIRYLELRFKNVVILVTWSNLYMYKSNYNKLIWCFRKVLYQVVKVLVHGIYLCGEVLVFLLDCYSMARKLSCKFYFILYIFSGACTLRTSVCMFTEIEISVLYISNFIPNYVTYRQSLYYFRKIRKISYKIRSKIKG